MSLPQSSSLSSSFNIGIDMPNVKYYILSSPRLTISATLGFPHVEVLGQVTALTLPSALLPSLRDKAQNNPSERQDCNDSGGANWAKPASSANDKEKAESGNHLNAATLASN